MILVAAIALATAARVETIGFTTVGARGALRVAVAGRPAAVLLQREGDTARVVITGAELGLRFGGLRRVVWRAGQRSNPAWLAASRLRWLEGLEIDAGAAVVSLVLRCPRETTTELRRDAQGLLVVLGSVPRRVTKDDGLRAPAAKAVSQADPSVAAPEAPQRGSAASRPTPSEPPLGAYTASIGELYSRLFPPAPSEPLAARAEPVWPEGTGRRGFRLRGSVEARYVTADAFLESAAPQRDHYLELDPRVGVELPIRRGRLSAEYKPALRALGTYDQTNSDSHLAGGTLELPVGGRLTLRANERLVVGTLDVRLVDPGGEYFFDLGRFRRHDLEGGTSIAVGERTSLELAGGFGSVHFLEQSSFFDYDARHASAGLGLELTPNLKALAAYRYDAVPQPPERPEAGSRAHSASLTFSGDLLPLVSGTLGVGYRSQSNPLAGEDGRRYSGLTCSGALTRRLGPESSVSLYLSRSTPVSAYGTNGFYVTTAVQAAWRVRLPLALELRGGLGRQWNAYRVVAAGASEPRHDSILSWYAALRRPLLWRLALSGSYRSERRRSSDASFATHDGGFVLQVEWSVAGSVGR